ncbi:MAG TPA: histidine phosphatase family protein, partial [Phycisphaerae bacterium]|nr:histidine phosphatase family protein [Phycisphaerae bacterium]
ATRTQVQHARAAAGLPVTADLADWSGLPGIEPNDELYARTAAALRDISARHPASDVLVVTHGGVIGRVLFRTLGIPDSAPRRFPLSNGICAVIEPAGDSFYLLTLADLPLLAGRPPAPDTAMSPPPVPHA